MSAWRRAGGHVLLCCHSSMLTSQKALGKELMRAVAVGETARVQELIASGADVETRNPEVGFMLTLGVTLGRAPDACHENWLAVGEHNCLCCVCTT